MERIRAHVIAGSLLVALGCGGADRDGGPPEPDAEVIQKTAEAADAAEPADAPAPVLSSLDDLSPEFQRLMEPWTGDLEGMAQRRAIRVLTANNPMLYAMDGVEQRGIVYESATLFEKFVNEHLQTGRLKIRVVIVPVLRDELVPAMVEGRGDIAAANLTITPERLEFIDFSDPFLGDVSEIMVTGPSSPPLHDLDSLAGMELHLRPSSSYWRSVERLNASLAERSLSPVKLTVAPPHLEDHDLIEMAHAGMLPFTVVDSHKARFWERVFDDLTVREDLAVAEGGKIGWAIRKGSPKLRELVNAFVRKHRRGTLIGNVLHNRYLEDTTWIENHLDGPGRRRFEETAPLFRTYGERYDLDWVLLAAQGYQESRLDQSRKSHRGAVGVMQVLPSTARSVDVTGIHELEPNIHAGARYMRHIADHYFGDEDLDSEQQHLLALAAYNAGPTRMRKLRREAAAKGLDPDVWFDNVEVVVAKRVGSETVRYVENIWKYHVAYTLLAEQAAPTDSAEEGRRP